MGLMTVFGNGLVLLSSGAESSTSFLDSGIFTFIAEGAKTVIGLFSIHSLWAHLSELVLLALWSVL